MAKRGKINQKLGKEREERPVRYKKYQQFFLVVCEDEATEPTYFERFKAEFPANTLFLKPVGTGKDPKGVVLQAILEKETLKSESNREIDFVWVVFDKDDADLNETKKQNFEDAFKIAEKAQMQIAYSNEVFELWLLLHLRNIDASIPIPRKQIYEMLEKAINESGSKYENFVYEHGKTLVLEIIEQIGNEKEAILKADKLLSFHKGKNSIESNPSTKVHKLVKELRNWIAYYNYSPD